MATASTEKLKTLLQCPVCLEVLSKPKVFQCLHFCCQPCIDGMKQKTEHSKIGYACPICREFTACKKLRAMHFVHELLEVIALAQEEQQIKCDSCKSEVAISRCIECKQNFCNACRGSHDGFAFMANHTWQELGDVPHTIVDKHIYCENHKSELLRFHCKDCNQLICLLCNGTEHKNHLAETIEDALNRIIPQIKQKRKQVTEKILENEKLLTLTEGDAQEIKKTFDALENAIDVKSEQMMSKVRQDTEEAKRELADLRQRRIGTIDAFMFDLKRKIQGQKSIVALSDTTLSTVQGASLLQTLQHDVNRSLDTYLNEPTSARPDVSDGKPTLHTSPSPVSTLIGTINEENTTARLVDAQIKNFIDNHGTLVTTLQLNHSHSRFTKIEKTLWCIQYESNKIHVFSEDGTKQNVITLQNVGECRAIAKIENGLVVGTSTGLYLTDMAGKVQKTLLNVHVCDLVVANNMIYALQRDHKIISCFLTAPGYNKKEDIEIHTNLNNFLSTLIVTAKYIYIGDCGGHQIIQYNHQGDVLAVFGKCGKLLGELVYPKLCCIDTEGMLLIADEDNNRLVTLSADGKWQKLQLGGASLQSPRFATLDGNSLYVAEAFGALKLFTVNN